MIWLVQLCLLIVLLPLSYGPIGHYITLAHGGPDLIIVSVWAFSWLTNRRIALQWAILLGVAMDLLSFWPFGVWTAILIGLTLGLDYVKTRFLDVSSAIQSLLALVAANVAFMAVELAITRNFALWPLLVSVSCNVLLGAIVYYVLAVRYRLNERWEGTRL